MLNVAMLSVVMLNVIMLNVVILSDDILSVVAPPSIGMCPTRPVRVKSRNEKKKNSPEFNSVSFDFKIPELSSHPDSILQNFLQSWIEYIYCLDKSWPRLRQE
jgi:hypothetical protein